jgi:SAM-dependent methyltransferase
MTICAVCGAPSHHTFDHDGYSLFECDDLNCRHVFVHPSPDEEELRAVYDVAEASIANSDSWTMARDYGRAPDLVRRYYRTTRIDWLLKNRCLESPETVILDIGCSTGMFLRSLFDLGYRNVYGMDLSDLHCRYCRETHGFPCVNSLDAIPDEKFDLITCYAVLEHTRAPVEFLSALRRKLRHGGKIVVLVPNYRSFYRSVAGKSWVWLIPPVHLQYFGPKSLDRAFERSGFNTISRLSDYSGTYIYLLVHHAMRVFGRPMPGTGRSNRSVPMWFVNSVEAALKAALSPVTVVAAATRRHNGLTYVAEA